MTAPSPKKRLVSRPLSPDHKRNKPTAYLRNDGSMEPQPDNQAAIHVNGRRWSNVANTRPSSRHMNQREATISGKITNNRRENTAPLARYSDVVRTKQPDSDDVFFLRNIRQKQDLLLNSTQSEAYRPTQICGTMDPQPSKAPEEDLVQPTQRPTVTPPTQTLSHRMRSSTPGGRSDTRSPHSETPHPQTQRHPSESTYQAVKDLALETQNNTTRTSSSHGFKGHHNQGRMIGAGRASGRSPCLDSLTTKHKRGTKSTHAPSRGQFPPIGDVQGARYFQTSQFWNRMPASTNKLAPVQSSKDDSAPKGSLGLQQAMESRSLEDDIPQCSPLDLGSPLSTGPLSGNLDLMTRCADTVPASFELMVSEDRHIHDEQVARSCCPSPQLRAGSVSEQPSQPSRMGTDSKIQPTTITDPQDAEKATPLCLKDNMDCVMSYDDHVRLLQSAFEDEEMHLCSANPDDRKENAYFLVDLAKIISPQIFKDPGEGKETPDFRSVYTNFDPSQIGTQPPLVVYAANTEHIPLEVIDSPADMAVGAQQRPGEQDEDATPRNHESPRRQQQFVQSRESYTQQPGPEEQQPIPTSDAAAPTGEESTSVQLPEHGEVQPRLQPTFVPEIQETLDALPERTSLSPSRINETSRWSPDSSELSERPSSQDDSLDEGKPKDVKGKYSVRDSDQASPQGQSTEQIQTAAHGRPVIQDMTRGGPVLAGAVPWYPGWSQVVDQPRDSEEYNRHNDDQNMNGSDASQADTENRNQGRDRGRMIVSGIGQLHPPSSLEPFPDYTEEGVELQDRGGEGAKQRSRSSPGAGRCRLCRLINVIVGCCCGKRKDCWFCRRKKARRQEETASVIPDGPVGGDGGIPDRESQQDHEMLDDILNPPGSQSGTRTLNPSGSQSGTRTMTEHDSQQTQASSSSDHVSMDPTDRTRHWTSFRYPRAGSRVSLQRPPPSWYIEVTTSIAAAGDAGPATNVESTIGNASSSVNHAESTGRNDHVAKTVEVQRQQDGTRPPSSSLAAQYMTTASRTTTLEAAADADLTSASRSTTLEDATTAEDATPVEESTTQDANPAENTTTTEVATSVEDSTTPQDATVAEEYTTTIDPRAPEYAHTTARLIAESHTDLRLRPHAQSDPTRRLSAPIYENAQLSSTP